MLMVLLCFNNRKETQVNVSLKMFNKQKIDLTQILPITINNKKYYMYKVFLEKIPIFIDYIKGNTDGEIKINIPIGNDDNINTFLVALFSGRFNCLNMEDNLEELLDICRLTKYFSLTQSDLKINIYISIPERLAIINNALINKRIQDVSPFINTIFNDKIFVVCEFYTSLHQELKKYCCIESEDITAIHKVFMLLKETNCIQHEPKLTFYYDCSIFTDSLYNIFFDDVIKKIDKNVHELKNIEEKYLRYVILTFFINPSILGFILKTDIENKSISFSKRLDKFIEALHINLSITNIQMDPFSFDVNGVNVSKLNLPANTYMALQITLYNSIYDNLHK